MLNSITTEQQQAELIPKEQQHAEFYRNRTAAD
jgi:hypothetical protein